jgi:hypothetical protein
LNLAPDKPAVFREIARVLKPGGRLAGSDFALKREFPEAIARSMAACVGCIAGAIGINTARGCSLLAMCRGCGRRGVAAVGFDWSFQLHRQHSGRKHLSE